MAQILENITYILLGLQRSIDTIATTVATQGSTLAAQGNTLTELQCLFGVSTTQPPPVTHLVSPPPPPPPLPADEFPELHSLEDMRVPIQTSGGSLPLQQPTGVLFPSEAPKSDPTILKLAKLEKLFKKAQ
ncbi:E3 SUMO-protein ligase EGR2-like [Camellia sinensis]|uniref:E3 SUMO-protein ligase EGR2-like n=1 Tax=Camellia sinensis TaxID=4442 RepID=UPI001035B9EE|nr:E3 SUMO-protein ligase EGR2-like [Camellia sinensis]